MNDAYSFTIGGINSRVMSEATWLINSYHTATYTRDTIYYKIDPPFFILVICRYGDLGRWPKDYQGINTHTVDTVNYYDAWYIATLNTRDEIYIEGNGNANNWPFKLYGGIGNRVAGINYNDPRPGSWYASKALFATITK